MAKKKCDHDFRFGGWKKKYHIAKIDGTACDPNADYFVLRLDEDPNALVAALAYANSVMGVNKTFAKDIIGRIRRYRKVYFSKPLNVWKFFPV